jgi:DNA-binding protein H-NS
MENYDLKSMSVDQLWDLHERLVIELARKIVSEKAKLEQRLRNLGVADRSRQPDRERRPYPKVLPKYQNPNNPAETWAGRGRQPRWMTALLRSGKKQDDFLIQRNRRRAG